MHASNDDYSYEDAGYRKSDLTKVSGLLHTSIQRLIFQFKMIFLLNSKPVDALAIVVHRSAQQTVGRAWVKKLRELFGIFYGYNSLSFCSQTK
jgi:translation elongation factor EF-4